MLCRPVVTPLGIVLLAMISAARAQVPAEVAELANEIGPKAAKKVASALFGVAVSNVSQGYSTKVVFADPKKNEKPDSKNDENQRYLALPHPVKVKMTADGNGKTAIADSSNAPIVITVDVDIEVVLLQRISAEGYSDG